MGTGTGTRLLYLDDSGKPDLNHASSAVVIAGFAIDAEQYPAFARCINGAKHAAFPHRGDSSAYEVKSTELVKPNPWKRRKNRDFCDEIARLLDDFDTTVYSCTLTKQRMHHPMTLATTMPLQLQALVEHFSLECLTLDKTGMVISDWSSHHNDQHASRCVGSFAASRRLRIHPCVYYASSHHSEGVQIADLIAAVRRRSAEGDAALKPLNQRLSQIAAVAPAKRTVRGRKFESSIELF